MIGIFVELAVVDEVLCVPGSIDVKFEVFILDWEKNVAVDVVAGNFVVDAFENFGTKVDETAICMEVVEGFVVEIVGTRMPNISLSKPGTMGLENTEPTK